MQRSSSIISVSSNDRAIDNNTSGKRFRRSNPIAILLTIIPLASALIFVDPVAPSASAHPTCDGLYHSHLNPLEGTWRVRNTRYSRGYKLIYWEYSNIFDFNQDTGQRNWVGFGYIRCPIKRPAP